MKKVDPKDLGAIALEWDEISCKRDKVIESGLDFSLEMVNAPAILRQAIEHCNSESIIDVGCGTGYLSALLSKQAGSVVGIDISEKSIKTATKRHKNIHNVQFTCSSIYDYQPNERFSLCVANMVFMADPNYFSDLKAIYNLLHDGGQIIFSITHPCFWPYYWGYQAEAWFRYNEECFIENSFATSLSGNIGITTHIHRPLSLYLNSLRDAGFTLCEVIEPYPITTPPPGYRFDVPRFLHIRATKGKS